MAGDVAGELVLVFEQQQLLPTGGRCPAVTDEGINRRGMDPEGVRGHAVTLAEPLDPHRRRLRCGSPASAVPTRTLVSTE